MRLPIWVKWLVIHLSNEFEVMGFYVCDVNTKQGMSLLDSVEKVVTNFI